MEKKKITFSTKFCWLEIWASIKLKMFALLFFSRRQSYKRNFILKKTKLVLNFLTIKIKLLYCYNLN